MGNPTEDRLDAIDRQIARMNRPEPAARRRARRATGRETERAQVAARAAQAPRQQARAADTAPTDPDRPAGRPGPFAGCLRPVPLVFGGADRPEQG